VASQICASAHAESASIEVVDGTYKVRINEDRMDKRYGSLEAMRQSGGEHVVAHSVLFWFWVNEQANCPAVVWQIMNTTALRRRRVVYRYDPELAYELAQAMPQSPYLIPEEWEFSWGNRRDTTLLVNSLSVRVLYHLVAVQFGAQKYRLRGGAEHDLLLVQSRAQWIEDVEIFSQINVKNIERFVDTLTFGRGSKSPDQALQPLVPLGADKLGLGPLGWLSSNAERNLLSLQARLEPRALDRQSHLFERQMTSQLLEAFRAIWPHAAANLTLTLSGVKEEFDLLVCEPETKTIAALELRWMLPPGDPREVQTRKSACWQKVEQAKRKAAALATALEPALLSALGLRIDGEGWRVRALVVIEGFGGAKSLDPDIPVVPDWVLKAGIEALPSLQRLVDWARSLDWLPTEGRDFEVIVSKPHLDFVSLEYPGLNPLRPGREYLADATKNRIDPVNSCSGVNLERTQL
jgi:hypothetical protein